MEDGDDGDPGNAKPAGDAGEYAVVPGEEVAAGGVVEPAEARLLVHRAGDDGSGVGEVGLADEQDFAAVLDGSPEVEVGVPEGAGDGVVGDEVMA